MTSPVLSLWGYYLEVTRYSHPSLDAIGPETCVIYLRISQDRTGQQLGVERQRKDCRELAARQGLTVTKVYIDNDISATNGKARPAFEAMLRDRPEAIVAWHQDRLLRLTSDLEKVIAQEVPVFMVTAGSLDLSTPAGRAVARTVAAWSQYEGEQKALRQKASNIQRAESGHWHFSNRPYGYLREKGQTEVTVVESEAAIVREGYRRYIEGDSYYAIANDWNERGVPTFGGPWSMARVQQLLRNEHYAGIVSYKGQPINVAPQWEPLIDARTWSDYIETREGRARAGSWSTKTKHLLSGLLRCGVCGSRMLARPETHRRGADRAAHMRLTYTCTTGWCVSILTRDIEPAVNEFIVAHLSDKKVLRSLRKTPDTEPVEKELADLRKRRADVTDLLADGLLDRRRARAQVTGLSERIDALAARLGAMRRESPLTDLVLARSVERAWNRMPLLEQRRVIEELGLIVTVGKGRPGRRPHDKNGQPIPDLGRIKFSWLDGDAELEAGTATVA